jgi:3,4-dihydroxy-9,10-secoandrosta-1,3,5(10)-triene-9,17-dione 4,5-dioxygenase
MISSLAYLELASPSPLEWRAFATEVLGMEVCEDERGALALRLDDRHYRARIVPAERAALAVLGFEVASHEGLASLGKALAAAGIATALASAELCRLRHAERVLVCRDPAGRCIELAAGIADAPNAFAPPGHVSGFRAGALGFGHVTLNARDPRATRAFYEGSLGLRAINVAPTDPPRVVLLRCNERHHSIGFTTTGTDGLNHVMFEARDMHDVGRALDALRAHGAQPAVELGWFTNDHVFSFFAWGPDRTLVELGSGSRLVSANCGVEPVVPGSWGHRGFAEAGTERARFEMNRA